MLRRAFLRRMAFAALATWFVDLPLPKEPVVALGDEWSAVFPLPEPRPMTVYVRFRERATGGEREVVFSTDSLPVDLIDYGVPPAHEQIGFGPITVAQGTRTLDEMRALSRA